MFLIRDKLNEYLICSHAGGFFSRLTLQRVMEVESRSERFRVPKTSFQENVLVNDAVPASTKYKNKWAVSIFAEWQRLREVQVPVLDCGGLFKDYHYRSERRYCQNGCSVAELLVVKIQGGGS